MTTKLSTPICAGVLKGADLTQPTIPVIYYTPVKRLSQAHAAYCIECRTLFMESVPWHWAKSAAMHRRGTGHTVHNVTWEVRHEASSLWEISL